MANANATATAFVDMLQAFSDRPSYGIPTAVFTAGLANRFQSGTLNESPVDAITSTILGTIIPTVIIEFLAPEKTRPYITGLLYGISCYKVGCTLNKLYNEPEMVKTFHKIEVDGKTLNITYTEPCVITTPNKGVV